MLHTRREQEPPLLPLPAKAPFPSVTSLGFGNRDAEQLSTYWRFYWAVAAAQLSRWLARYPAGVLDLSGPRPRCAVQAAAAGHTVIELRTRYDAAAGTAPDAGRRESGGRRNSAGGAGAGRVHPVVADPDRLGFIAAGSMDAV